MSSARPNIVWITLDSVRADHTSLHGYKRQTTPELRRLAEEAEGVAFDHCIAHSTRTPVSVPSMLTGTYPSHHRVGLGEGSCGRIPSSLSTVPELFQNCGYRTVAVSRNAYAGRATGLDRGFETYVRPTIAGDLLTYPHFLSLIRYGLDAWHHSGGLTRDRQKHPKSHINTDIAKRLLRSSDDRPVFCYLHYNDPHRPYFPPRSYLRRFTDEVAADPTEARAFAEDMHENAYEYMANGLPFSERQWSMLYAMYDAVIAYTDRCIGRLVEFIREELDDTIVVVTADHGELFGERGLLGHHIILDDAVTHVPLVVHGYPEFAEAAEGPVQHIDVMQTLLLIAGGDTSQLQGYDLRREQRPFAVSQDLRETVDDESRENYARILEYNPDFDTSNLPQSMVTALRTESYKLVRTVERTRLYELPDETTDLIDSHPEKANKFGSKLRAWENEYGTSFEETPRASNHGADVKAQLRQLGYFE